jgi:1-acyl-sn-glycerol-3-phosphate acyltransferase
MNVAFYKSGRLACRLVKVQCIREMVLDAHRADRSGGFLLAVTHLSHLEPFVVGMLVPRVVRWMAREEFYRRRWASAVLHRGGAFPIDRFGFSLPAVRQAIRLVGRGEIVGIFPEGGVAQGRQSVLRGGPLKQGVCTISMRTGAPVVPVVVLGTERLNRVGPWLPARRGRIWVAFGRDVEPPWERQGNRADRAEMAARLGEEFRRTYRELLEHSRLSDDDVP